MPIGDIRDSYDVSVAILTRNAGPDFARLLDALFAQQTRLDVEVIAVDSGSTDGTLDVLGSRPVRLLTIPQADFNWGATRDYAYEQTRGRVIINLSQDAVPASAMWLDRLVKPLDGPDAGASCGSSIPDPQKEARQFPWERNGYFYFTREIRRFTARYGRGLSFANSAVPRAVWEELRFDPQATGEDFQFQMKLHEAGLRVVFPDDAPVLHHHNYGLGALWRRCRNEGFALKTMGFGYSEADLALDLLSPKKFAQWLRELKRGSLDSAAAALFPVVRPLAVYVGSRFTQRPVWY